MKLKIKLSWLIFAIILIGLTGIIIAKEDNTITFTMVSPLNGSVKNSWSTWIINMTTNESVSACNVTMYLANTTQIAAWTNITLTNSTGTIWVNSTEITEVMTDSVWNQYHNLTFVCDIHPGLHSWNQTNGNKFFYFKVDTANPQNRWINFTQENSSSTGFLTIRYNVTDNNTDTCRVGITHEDGTHNWYYPTQSSATLTTGGSNVTCTMNINGTHITQDGDFTLVYYANDTAANAANASTNEAGVANLLKTGWNFVTFTGDELISTKGGTNSTLSLIINQLPNCTQISQWYNNNSKVYTTYSKSVPTVNNATGVQLGNVTAIYCTGNDYYLRKNYLSQIYGTGDENVTLRTNTTNWNLFGMIVDKTLNQTLYPTDFKIGGAINITAVSYFNATLQRFVTCVKEFSGTLCSSGFNATSITVTKASGLWVNYINDRATAVLNRTGI